MPNMAFAVSRASGSSLPNNCHTRSKDKSNNIIIKDENARTTVRDDTEDEKTGERIGGDMGDLAAEGAAAAVCFISGCFSLLSPPDCLGRRWHARRCLPVV
jgi:hypothetical protein